ncbi:MAG: hypothetical protein ACKPKO_28130 [Candidatus Fonsibacter sp.]
MNKISHYHMLSNIICVLHTTVGYFQFLIIHLCHNILLIDIKLNILLISYVSFNFFSYFANQ